MPFPFPRLRLAGVPLLAFGVLAAELKAGSDAEPPVESTPVAAAVPEENWAQVRAETFELVWTTVNESYFDANFSGVDWKAKGAEYRAKLSAVADKPALRALLQTMLRELGRSHFSILPREAVVFTPAEQRQVGGAGVEVVSSPEGVAVRTVAAGSAGEAAGLRAGDVVLGVGSVALAELSVQLEKTDVVASRRDGYLVGAVDKRLRGPVGNSVRLRVRQADGTEREVELGLTEQDVRWSEPVGNLPAQPLVIEGDVRPEGLAYLHFSVFTRQLMREILAVVKRVPADGGLVLDLRGNPGGLTAMATGLSGWLSDKEFSLGTMQLRQGFLGMSVYPQDDAFLGPLAILVDSGSASTSEILAAGLQAARRARIFGTRTPGAALPSLFKRLPTADLFQYAVGDMQTPQGIALEGHGVIPDEAIARTAADLAAGRDPVRAAAETWLRREVRLRKLAALEKAATP